MCTRSYFVVTKFLSRGLDTFSFGPKNFREKKTVQKRYTLELKPRHSVVYCQCSIVLYYSFFILLWLVACLMGPRHDANICANRVFLQAIGQCMVERNDIRIRH